MGWFGFGGSRSRDERARADARSNKNAADARSNKNGARFLHEAVRIDRAGKPSRLPDDRPRRRDRDDRWDRR
jgi:hypothetical protein